MPWKQKNGNVFELPFDYERFGKTIDLEKLAKGQYNISIILSASKTETNSKVLPAAHYLLTIWK